MQFELAGALGIGAGRYLVREGGEEGPQSVLVVEVHGAPAAGGRRRQRPREADAEAPLPALPLTRVTAIRAHEPFASAEEASRWLEGAVATEEEIDALVAEGARLLNRALHAQAVAAADPRDRQVAAEEAVTVRIGIGSGEEVAAGRHTQAVEVDVRGGTPRRRRQEELRPQERVAAILGGRERPDACETLLLRARADLDADRPREAALQLSAALEAMLVEMAGALADPGHGTDMAQLQARRKEAAEAASSALHGELDARDQDMVRELMELAERVLRRRRILRG